METIIHELIVVYGVDDPLKVIHFAAALHRPKPSWFLASVVHYDGSLKTSYFIEEGDISSVAHVPGSRYTEFEHWIHPLNAMSVMEF